MCQAHGIAIATSWLFPFFSLFQPAWPNFGKASAVRQIASLPPGCYTEGFMIVAAHQAQIITPPPPCLIRAVLVFTIYDQTTSFCSHLRSLGSPALGNFSTKGILLRSVVSIRSWTAACRVGRVTLFALCLSITSSGRNLLRWLWNEMFQTSKLPTSALIQVITLTDNQ